MLSREELVRAIYEIGKLSLSGEKDVLDQETKAIEARLAEDLDCSQPMRFAETTLFDMTVKMTEDATIKTAMESNMTDDELAEVHNWLTSHTGQKWQKIRAETWALTSKIRAEFHKLLGNHMSNMLFTKLLRTLVYTVHQIVPNMEFPELLAFCEKVIKINPFFSPRANEKAFAVERSKGAFELPDIEQSESAITADPATMKQQCIARAVLQCANGSTHEWPKQADVINQ